MDEEQQPKFKIYEQVPVDEDDDDESYGGNTGLDHDLNAASSDDDHLLVATNNTARVEQPQIDAWTWQHALHTTLIPDTACTSIRNIPIVEGPFTIKLLKFVLFTFLGIGFMHWLVSHRSEHRDADLNFWEIWLFDGNLIASDCVVFFLVGRLWKQKGVDHLAWIGMVAISNLYFESQHYVSFLKHALTMYEMVCVWPWSLWVFFAIVLPLCILAIVFHIIRAYRTHVLLMKLVEVSVAFLFYLAPLIGSPYFHPHHWYVGWLAGMHFNFDRWWSRACMAFMWGAYINGIAVYGRDPVLTCEYAYFLTVDQACPYVNCYIEGLANPPNTTDTNHTAVKPMIPPDWRNCSAKSYHG